MVRPPSEILLCGGAMKRFVLTLAFCVMVLPGQALHGPVLAQQIPVLSDLEISLWPEYDRPEVLVIYRGLFAEDTPLPVPVEIFIPARVGQPTAVAYVGEGGQRLNQEHTTRMEGDWLVVAFELPTLGFQLEYYDALPVDSAGQREYAYTFSADYPITNLALDFQVPPTAEGFTLDPPADSVVTESDGLDYHIVNTGALTQGEEKSWTFTYYKDDDELTASSLVQPGTPVPGAPPAAEGTDNSTVLIFLVAFVALIAVGGAAFWLGRRTQPVQPESSLSQRRKRRGSGRGSQPLHQRSPLSAGEEALFCHQCGAELRADSDFCQKCGTPVRRG
jgi:hypothetical protein